MPQTNFLTCPFEFKTAPTGNNIGAVEGYGSIFGNLDAYNDVVQPGAFEETLAQYKSQNLPIPMKILHGVWGGTDSLPVGVWTDYSEDSKGLYLKGKLSGLNTDTGKMRYELLRDKALSGLSIGYSIPDGGAKRVKGKRELHKIELLEISLVDTPANNLARITNLKRFMSGQKSIFGFSDAAINLQSALELCQSCLLEGNSPTKDERELLISSFSKALDALTGTNATKSVSKETVTQLTTRLQAINFN
ncbi:HK97 family phage prohead protease [Aristophania vespae]|uniref:HK97 family phage prohead protease n=1 Tax=Aristophania vespae TaxID=2697033 RepID=UPI0023514BD6|nr:HK97 family phage prohead protease [Aristophania vespae]UMM63104.1 hypothetical protein DM15PD_00580 [Aristophania vespae]